MELETTFKVYPVEGLEVELNYPTLDILHELKMIQEDEDKLYKFFRENVFAGWNATKGGEPLDFDKCPFPILQSVMNEYSSKMEENMDTDPKGQEKSKSQ